MLKFRTGTILLFILLAFYGTLCTAETVKVVAVNLEWFPGQRPKSHWIASWRHMNKVKASLTEVSPDILIATEICDTNAFLRVIKPVNNLDLHVASNFTDVEDGGDRRNQQIAIASKFKAFAGWAEPWEQTVENIRRGFSFAALENPASGRLLLVYGLHLKSNRSKTPEEEQQNYDIRDASIKQLLAHMKKMEMQFAEKGIDGWIVAGDFNTNHDGRFRDHVISMLEEDGFYNSWKNTLAENRYTWRGRGDFGSTTFDYIMTKGLGERDATLHINSDSVSDHNAVILSIDLPSEAKPESISTEASIESGPAF